MRFPRYMWFLVLGFFITGCPVPNNQKTTLGNGEPFGVEQSPVTFDDATQQVGIKFRHQSGAQGKKYMPETVGSGVAFLDYNNDGKLDLFYVNSTDWKNAKNPKPHYPALYHNNGDGTFSDVTEKAGLKKNDYGQGAAIGDYNNDGYSDIYLTCIGPNRLYRNNKDGTFTEVTKEAGVVGVPVQPGGITYKWSSSAAWCDYNKDGNPDLFVCSYVHWTPETDVFCTSRGGKKAYCAPHNYQGLPSTLYRGNGDGTFTDVSKETGILQHSGKSLGIVIKDFNQDGWQDIAVTNDTTPNFLFINEDGKRFKEIGLEAGIAVTEAGQPKAGMGIDSADFQNNGKPGILTGNFSKECLSLYTNDGTAQFQDVAHPLGVAEPSIQFLTFGLFFFDYDLDGWQDILTANGHIDDYVHESDAMITYKERPLLYHNEGGSFRELGKTSGAALQLQIVGRGCAWGDYDTDGDPDIAIVSNNGKGYLWRNTPSKKNQWIGIKLRGTKSTRDAWGAVVRVTANGFTQRYENYGGGSFLSQRQPWILLGLKDATSVSSIEIDWLSGEKTKIGTMPAGKYYLIEEGTSEARPLVP